MLQIFGDMQQYTRLQDIAMRYNGEHDAAGVAQLKTMPRRASISDGLTVMSSSLLRCTRKPVRLNRLILIPRARNLNFGMVGTMSCMENDDLVANFNRL